MCPISFAQHSMWEAHPCRCRCQYFLPFFHRVPSCCLYYHSPAGKNLRYSQFLTIMNKVSMNICILALLWHMYSVLLGKFQSVQLLDHMVSICLTNACLFVHVRKTFSRSEIAQLQEIWSFLEWYHQNGSVGDPSLYPSPQRLTIRQLFLNKNNSQKKRW